MKTINYKQYYYKGNKDCLLVVPDTSTLYEVYSSFSHKIKDEIWTKSYIILCPTEFKNSTLLGDIYFAYLEDIFIISSEIELYDIENAPKLNEVYSVTYYNDKEAEKVLDSYTKSISGTPEEIEKLIELYKNVKKIGSIRKLKKFTSNGVQASDIIFKDLKGDNIAYMNSVNVAFNRISLEEYSTNVSELFYKEAERIYKTIIS